MRFKRLIMDNGETDRSPTPPERPDVQRVVLCSGKVYYELEAAREAAGKEGQVAICRLEQLAPFPFDLVMRELKRYPNAHVRPATCMRVYDRDSVARAARWLTLRQRLLRKLQQLFVSTAFARPVPTKTT